MTEAQRKKLAEIYERFEANGAAHAIQGWCKEFNGE